MDNLRYRQIHLDFHTSELIRDIGKDFSKKNFQEALLAGHVDSITLFSKCHHGWAYHPSKVNTIHPNLSFDLLKAQIEAAHEISVKTPVYISAGIDEKLARKHPEWLLRNKDESTTWVEDFTKAGYHLFCFNNPYLDMLLSQIEEVVMNYEADGIFLDIVKPKACYCQNCINSMVEVGIDPYDEVNAIALGERVYKRYTSGVRKIIDQHKPGLPVFHNGGHISKGRRDLAHMNTHLELESLPTGGWGYDHFPMSARYANTLGLEYLGMTGKFHTMWGEFGGFKHPNALRYEMALNIASGAKCSIGDQLHPQGKMDPLTYEIIGKAYSEIETKEPWCDDVTSVVDVAVLSAETVESHNISDQSSEYLMDLGAVRMLLQHHFLFDVIDTQCDFSRYKVIILPDIIRINDDLQMKLLSFTEQGGKLLATGESGLDMEQNQFVLDLGVKWVGKCQNKPNYFRPSFEMALFNNSSYVFYEESEAVVVTNGTVLGRKEKSYFNREVFKFCSHQHAPNSLEDDGPGMVESDLGIYIPWKIFTDYGRLGSLPQRDVLVYALNRLLDEHKTIKTNLPSGGILTAMEQTKLSRMIVHLLYASPVLRGHSSVTGKAVEVIEDLIPIYETELVIKSSKEVQRVYLAPEMKELTYQIDGDYILISIDKFTCHQMVVLEFLD